MEGIDFWVVRNQPIARGRLFAYTESNILRNDFFEFYTIYAIRYFTDLKQFYNKSDKVLSIEIKCNIFLPYTIVIALIDWQYFSDCPCQPFYTVVLCRYSCMFRFRVKRKTYTLKTIHTVVTKLRDKSKKDRNTFLYLSHFVRIYFITRNLFISHNIPLTLGVIGG